MRPVVSTPTIAAKMLEPLSGSLAPSRLIVTLELFALKTLRVFDHMQRVGAGPCLEKHPGGGGGGSGFKGCPC